MNLFISSWNFTHAPSLTTGVSVFWADRSPAYNWISNNWAEVTSWLGQPYILAIIISWWITFTLIITLLLVFGGFGPAGIVAGSFAAGCQSWMYGGFTPAAGIFATLTSVGMLGFAVPVYTAIAAICATFVASLVWACGVGT